jgi:hypothetical protein
MCLLGTLIFPLLAFAFFGGFRGWDSFGAFGGCGDLLGGWVFGVIAGFLFTIFEVFDGVMWGYM